MRSRARDRARECDDEVERSIVSRDSRESRESRVAPRSLHTAPRHSSSRDVDDVDVQNVDFAVDRGMPLERSSSVGETRGALRGPARAARDAERARDRSWDGTERARVAIDSQRVTNEV